MGNIGDDEREIEFVPVPETEPSRRLTPTPEPQKAPEPQEVPEPERVAA